MTSADIYENIDSAWLRESVRIRAEQSRSAIWASSLMALVLLYALYGYLATAVILLWLASIIASLVLRYVISIRVLNGFQAKGDSVIRAADRKLRAVSVLTQLLVGSGVILCWDMPALMAAYIITAAQLLHGMGSMINLSYDYRSFAYSLPMLMLPPFFFWVLKEGPGTIISASIVFLSVLMLSLVRRSENSLRETFKMRFENLRLLHQLESEQQKTQEALDIAQKANQTRSFFMAAASHDLRQPLFALSILTDTLGLQTLPDSAKPIYEKQKTSVKALRGLFDNLLDLSKFDSGQIEPRLRDVALESLLRPIDEEFSTICEDRRLSWQIDHPQIAVTTDVELLQRVIRNLLTNATNFTEEGGISLIVRYHEGQADFEITDTGCGIPESDQARVFDDFVQLNNNNRVRTKGVGLGLAITKHINQLLGLNLTMRSTLKVGTSFRFQTPASALLKAPESEPQMQIPAEKIAGTRIWVFEDEELVKDALSYQFDAWGCPTEFYVSRQDWLRKNPDEESINWPDVIITDDMLDDSETGLDLAHAFADKIGARRILLMTGNSDPDRMAELDDSPFLFARKPIAVDWLVYWILTARHSQGAVSDHA